MKIFITTILITFFTSLSFAENILPASKTQRNQIQTALGEQYLISEIVTVKSGNHPNAYYIGAIFYAEGSGNIIGIWLGGDKDAWGLLFSVNGAAHRFSGMGKASRTKASAGIWDPEAKVLRKFLDTIK